MKAKKKLINVRMDHTHLVGYGTTYVQIEALVRNLLRKYSKLLKK